MRSGVWLAVLVGVILVIDSEACFRTSRTPSSKPTGVRRNVSFERLKNAYPTYPRYTAQDLRTDMELPDWLFSPGTPNTCAIRMSKAFHDAGVGISRSRVSDCSTSSARVNGKGRQYIVRALFFRCYLRAIWGRPDVTGITSKNDVTGKKGMLIFTGCSGFGQHIDLWDGYSCSLACDYFHRCTSVEMYTMQ